MTETNREVIRRICRAAAERAGFTVEPSEVYAEEITQTQDLEEKFKVGDGIYEIPSTDDVSSLNVLAQVNDAGIFRHPDEARSMQGVPEELTVVKIRFMKQPPDNYCYRLSVRTSEEAPQVKLLPSDIYESPAIRMTVQVGDSGPKDAMVGFVSTDAEVKVGFKDFGETNKDVTVTLTVNGTRGTNMLSAILSVVDEVSIVYRLASEDQYQTIGSYAAGSAYDVDIRSKVYDNLDRIDAELRSLVISNPRGGEIRSGLDFVEDSSTREAVFRRQRQVVIYPP